MELIREAIELHLESLRENGEFSPPPGTLGHTAALE
jgi:predicted RNase H-like HicB family nuclease